MPQGRIAVGGGGGKWRLRWNKDTAVGEPTWRRSSRLWQRRRQRLRWVFLLQIGRKPWRGKSWEVWPQLIRCSECQPGHRSNEHSALRAIENFGNFETTRMRETRVVRIKLIGASPCRVLKPKVSQEPDMINPHFSFDRFAGSTLPLGKNTFHLDVV